MSKQVTVTRDLGNLYAARNAALVAIIDQETGVRGFIATGNSMFLDVYRAGRTCFARAQHEEALTPHARGEIGDLGEIIHLNEARVIAAQHVQADLVRMIARAHGRAYGGVAVGTDLASEKRAADAFRLADDALRTRLESRQSESRAKFDGMLVWAQRGIWLMIGASLVLVGNLAVLIRASARIERDASRDPLTQLANRRSFDAHVQRLVAAASDAGERIGIIVLDLDDFKRINDTYGHQGGDAVLRAAGVRLAAAVKHTDVVARLGGDEFAIGFRLDADATPDALVSCVREVFTAPFALDAQTAIQASCSIGVTVSTDALSVDELLGRADRGMYAEKDRVRRNAAVRNTLVRQ